MLLYTDLLPSMLCLLLQVCCCTPQVSYLQCFVLCPRYVAEHHRSLTFNALSFAPGMLLYTTDLLPSMLCPLPQVCCCAPQISYLQCFVFCPRYVAVHHRSLTFNALSFAPGMLLYTTDLLPSMLCPLPQVCCCTPQIPYLQCFVLCPRYVAVHHRSLTFNALSFAPGMLLYTTDLLPSMLCPLPQVCCCTPQITYLQCLVLWPRYAAVHHRSLTFNALSFAPGMLLYTTDHLPSMLSPLTQVCCCTPQISYLQCFVFCPRYAAVHHRSLTFNALSFDPGMLLYTTDLLPSMLCPLTQVCCCTPQISYLECFVLVLGYVDIDRLFHEQISGQGSDLVMVDMFHHLIQQPCVHLVISSVLLRFLASTRHYLVLKEKVDM